jgi:hypothetical protein
MSLPIRTSTSKGAMKNRRIITMRKRLATPNLQKRTKL